MQKIEVRKYYDASKQEHRYEVKLPNGKIFDMAHAGDAFNLILGFAEFSQGHEIVLKSTEDR